MPDDQLTPDSPTLAADPPEQPPVAEHAGAPPTEGPPPAAAWPQPPPGTQLPPPAPWVQQPPTGVYPQCQPPPTGVYPQYQPPPTGVYPQYQPPPVAPAYGPPPSSGQPPLQPPALPASQGSGGGSQRGLIIALAGLIATLLLAAGVAIVLLVASGDEPAKRVTQEPVVRPQPPAAAVTKPIAKAKPKAKRKRTRRAATRSRSASVAPSTPTSSATSAGVDRQSVRSMLSRHFADIERGNLSAAFADLAPPLGQSESGWTSDIRADGLYSHSISVAPQITSSTSGVANIVSFHTEASASGCKDWSGSWNVLKTGGRWQISKSNLSQTVVNCGE